jgi:hypothetical protein
MCHGYENFQGESLVGVCQHSIRVLHPSVTACTFQTFSSTPLLALLLLPLDVFALSHLHAPLPHMHPLYSCKTKPWLPPMLVLCMWFDKRCWRGIPWCIMVHVWLGELDCLPLSKL